MKLFDKLYTEISAGVVGQEKMVRDLLIGLFTNGHILIEGAPGLAKTLAVSTLSKVVSLDFSRVQFTPDLLPSDLIGNKIYNPETKEFTTKKGPIFSNIVLCDEINRAPSKVQSALLEAMAEKQVTIGDETFAMNKNFMVLATQNPIEQDGTYSLPEAQLDRFLLKTIVSYPNRDEEKEIIKKYSVDNEIKLEKIIKKTDISNIKSEIEKVYVDDNILNYVNDIIFYTRESDDLKDLLIYGASPRASIALIKTAKALAYLNGRDFVIPEDIKEMALPVLRHRIILSYEAIAESVTSDEIITNILNKIEVK